MTKEIKADILPAITLERGYNCGHKVRAIVEIDKEKNESNITMLKGRTGNCLYSIREMLATLINYMVKRGTTFEEIKDLLRDVRCEGCLGNAKHCIIDILEEWEKFLKKEELK